MKIPNDSVGTCRDMSLQQNATALAMALQNN
jgi:hypothetical protein